MSPDVSPERPPRRPWAYFLTAACYGAHLHGQQDGSMDPRHRAWRGPMLDARPGRERFERAQLKEPPFEMDAVRRPLVLEAIHGTCDYQRWVLHAAHIRTNHFHVVVTAEEQPETVLGKLKAYASRALNERFGRRERYWARQGSTRWLWEPRDVNDAVDYVLNRQGEPMSVYENPNRWNEYLRT